MVFFKKIRKILKLIREMKIRVECPLVAYSQKCPQIAELKLSQPHIRGKTKLLVVTSIPQIVVAPGHEVVFLSLFYEHMEWGYYMVTQKCAQIRVNVGSRMA